MAITQCPTCGRQQRRSNPQNARYWLLLTNIGESIKPVGEEYSAEAWHNYFKLRFLGGDDIKMPNGKVIVIPKSTADLDQCEFNEYMAHVEAWAADRGVYLAE